MGTTEWIVAVVGALALILPRVWPLIKPYIKNPLVADGLGKGVDLLSALALRSKKGEAERFAMLLAWRDEAAKGEGPQKQLVVDAINQLIAVSFANLTINSSLVQAGLSQQSESAPAKAV